MPAPVARPTSDLLRFQTHHHLRHRLLLSILSGKSLRVDNIRSDDVHVGLRDYEINLLRLVEKVTNGSTIEISVTGTSFLFHPGLLPGGSFTHTCHVGRSIGYYLELLVPLAPFCKRPFDINLYGVTGEEGRDMTVDMVRTVTLPHLHLFGIIDGLELQIKKRGAAPLGGGQIIFKSPVVRHLKTLNFVERGKIRKIRGVAYSTRVSPQFANRMVDSARSVLNRYIPDIYLYTDVYKGDDSGKSPGYGLTLVSQSTTDALHASETLSRASSSASSSASAASTTTSQSASSNLPQTPEDLGLHAARLLLEEISRGGCVDSAHQWLVLLFMVLGKEDVGKCLFGSLTAHTVQFMRDLLLFFGVKFKITPVPRISTSKGQRSGANKTDVDDNDDDVLPERTDGTGEVLVSCVGVGYSNVNKAMA